MNVKELRLKSTPELHQLISDLKAELFMLRFQNSTGQLDQPHKITLIKKDIARVFTIIHEKNEKVNAKVDLKASKARVEKIIEDNEANKAKLPKEEIKKEGGE